MKDARLYAAVLLALLFAATSSSGNASEKIGELKHDGKMTYVAPAMSTNYVSKSSRDCPSRIRRATSSSATAKITLHVVDEEGNDIEGANVVFAFRKFDRSFSFDYKPPRTKKRKTDKNGRASASGESCWDVGFYVEKEGYYPVGGKYLLWVFVTREIVDWRGRWQPWNPTLEVRLKGKRKPVCESRLFAAKHVPFDTILAFDAGAIDFCPPFGFGSITNFFMSFSHVDVRTEGLNLYSNGVAIATLGDGISAISKVMDSTMQTPLEMPRELGPPQLNYSYYSINNRTMLNDDPFNADKVIAIDCLETNCVHRSILVTSLLTRYTAKTDNFEIVMGYIYNPLPGDKSLELNPNIRPKGWFQSEKDLRNPSPQRMR